MSYDSKVSIYLYAVCKYVTRLDTSYLILYIRIKIHNKGNYEDAIVVVEEALAINVKAFGKGNENVGDAVNSLGQLYLLKGDLDEAAPLLQEALKV